MFRASGCAEAHAVASLPHIARKRSLPPSIGVALHLHALSGTYVPRRHRGTRGGNPMDSHVINTNLPAMHGLPVTLGSQVPDPDHPYGRQSRFTSPRPRSRRLGLAATRRRARQRLRWCCVDRSRSNGRLPHQPRSLEPVAAGELWSRCSLERRDGAAGVGGKTRRDERLDQNERVALFWASTSAEKIGLNETAVRLCRRGLWSE